MVEPIGQGWVLDNFSLQKFIKNSNFEDKNIQNMRSLGILSSYYGKIGVYIQLCCK
jgi:predicted nuclease of restriction endonuclease-like (RecB) superfamily